MHQNEAETVEIGQKTADAIANWLESHWLTRYPWPTETTVAGQGKRIRQRSQRDSQKRTWCQTEDHCQLQSASELHD